MGLTLFIPILMPYFGRLHGLAGTLFCASYLINNVDDNNVYGPGEEELKKDKRILIIITTLTLLLLLFSFITPSKKDVAVMYIAPKIINNQDIQKIPGYLLKYIEKEVGDE